MEALLVELKNKWYLTILIAIIIMKNMSHSLTVQPNLSASMAIIIVTIVYTDKFWNVTIVTTI